MKNLIFLIVFIYITSAVPVQNEILEEWKTYKTNYNKSYSTAEDNMRLKLYLESKEIVQQHNIKYRKGESTFRMGINKFSDWLPQEKKLLLGYKPLPKFLNGLKDSHTKLRSILGSSRPEIFQSRPGIELPDSINWVEKGAVTSVKNQGRCGSCWAFGSVGVFEGQMYMKTKKLQSLSPQNLVDCSYLYGNDGCDGGLYSLAYEYVKHNQGLNSLDDYSYDGYDNSCRYSNKSVAATCTGYVVIPSKDEKKLQEAVATVGPIGISVNAYSIFSSYSDGILDGVCPNTVKDLDHAVLLVGYNTKPKGTNEVPYWIVKNSWGADWGEKGYIRMAMGKNLCGMALDPSYPIV